MSVLFDWKIQDIERTANEAKNRLHEVDSLRGDVGRLEHSLREVRAEVDWLRNELQACQETGRQLAELLQELSTVANTP